MKVDVACVVIDNMDMKYKHCIIFSCMQLITVKLLRLVVIISQISIILNTGTSFQSLFK